MTKLFKELLSVAFNPDSNESRRKMERLCDSALAGRRDDAYEAAVYCLEEEQVQGGDDVRKLTADNVHERVRELLLASPPEKTALIPTQYRDTVIEGTTPVVCMRQAFPSWKMPGPVFRVPIAPSSTYAPRIAEGAEYPIKVGNYAYRDWTAYKYGQRPLITREMVNDSYIDIVEQELRLAGRAMENTFNQQMLSVYLSSYDSTNMTVDADNDATKVGGVKAVATAMGLVKKKDFIPDTVILAPLAEAEILKEVLLTNYWGGESARNGALPGLVGLKPYSLSCSNAAGGTAWDYATTSDIGYLVCESGRALASGILEDVRVENYTDVIRDLAGSVVSARWAFNYQQQYSMAAVKYS